MASFFVETYVPPGDRDRFSRDVAGLHDTLEAIPELEGMVQVVRSYLVPSDELGVHVLEADTAEAILRLVKRAGIEVERIVPAIGDQVERGPDGPRAGRRRRGRDRSEEGREG